MPNTLVGLLMNWIDARGRLMGWLKKSRWISETRSPNPGQASRTMSVLAILSALENVLPVV